MRIGPDFSPEQGAAAVQFNLPVAQNRCKSPLLALAFCLHLEGA